MWASEGIIVFSAFSCFATDWNRINLSQTQAAKAQSGEGQIRSGAADLRELEKGPKADSELTADEIGQTTKARRGDQAVRWLRGLHQGEDIDPVLQVLNNLILCKR